MKEPWTMLYSAHLFVTCTKIDSPDAGKGNGTSTHGAGFQRDVQIAIDQPLAADLARCFADYQHLGVGGRVFQFEGAVAGDGQNFAVIGHHGCAHRHFASRCGGMGLCQRKAHGVWQFLLHRVR